MGTQKVDPEASNYNQLAHDNEAPVHPVEVSAIRIARFPITVMEYADFIDTGGYQDEHWWATRDYDETLAPEDWEGQLEHPSRPVTGISWYEASAYCVWLTDRLSRPQEPEAEILCPDDRKVRLPTEAEWEYAARGSEGRTFPWGNESPGGEQSNFLETHISAPSPVGVFPNDCTPEGMLDMAGNVKEWCLDAYDKDYYQACKGRGVVTNPSLGDIAGGQRMLRGGSFVDDARSLRASNRDTLEAEGRKQYIGFRCVLAPCRKS
jgi:formylglycine-generating enzyme required for sulfatase activity